VNNELQDLSIVKEQLKNPKDLPKALESFLSEKEKLTKQIDHLQSQILDTVTEQIRRKAIWINDVNFIGEIVNISTADALKKLALLLKDKLRDSVIVLCANIESKANVVVSIDENIHSSKNLDAVKMIREIIAPLIKGGGGGQKAFASAGGQDVTKFEEVIEKIKRLL